MGFLHLLTFFSVLPLIPYKRPIDVLVQILICYKVDTLGRPKCLQEKAAGPEAVRANKNGRNSPSNEKPSKREGTRNRTWRQPSQVTVPVQTPPIAVALYGAICIMAF
jgi:hypothetical protein